MTSFGLHGVLNLISYTHATQRPADAASISFSGQVRQRAGGCRGFRIALNVQQARPSFAALSSRSSQKEINTGYGLLSWIFQGRNPRQIRGADKRHEAYRDILSICAFQDLRASEGKVSLETIMR